MGLDKRADRTGSKRVLSGTLLKGKRFSSVATRHNKPKLNGHRCMHFNINRQRKTERQYRKVKRLG